MWSEMEYLKIFIGILDLTKAGVTWIVMIFDYYGLNNLFGPDF